MKNYLVLFTASLLAAFAVVFTVMTYSGELPTLAEGNGSHMTLTGLIGELFGE